MSADSLYDMKSEDRKPRNLSMKAFQEEHFRPTLYCYDPDVVATFVEYMKRLPFAAECKAFFYAAIDNPRGFRWYKANAGGVGPLKTLVKDLNAELGITDDQKDEHGAVSNKSGRTTMVSRMSEASVPEEIGILCTGHKSVGAYRRYDRSTDIKVRAAMRCAGGEGCSYEEALEEEHRIMKAGLIEGKAEMDDDSPSKKLKLMTLNDGSCSGEGRAMRDKEKSVQAKELKRVRVEEVQQKSYEPIVETVSSVVENRESDCASGMDSVAMGRSGGNTEQKAALQFMAEFDWASDLKQWEAERNNVVVNTFFGNIGGQCNVSVVFNGPVHLSHP